MMFQKFMNHTVGKASPLLGKPLRQLLDAAMWMFGMLNKDHHGFDI